MMRGGCYERRHNPRLAMVACRRVCGSFNTLGDADMKDVYLKAAKSVDKKTESLSCLEIVNAERVAEDAFSQTSNCFYVVPYRKLFSPNENETGCWLNRAQLEGRIGKDELKQWRVLALLFMHWISEGEK